MITNLFTHPIVSGYELHPDWQVDANGHLYLCQDELYTRGRVRRLVRPRTVYRILVRGQRWEWWAEGDQEIKCLALSKVQMCNLMAEPVRGPTVYGWREEGTLESYLTPRG